MSTLPAGVDMDRNGVNRWVAFDLNNTICSSGLKPMGELKYSKTCVKRPLLKATN